MRLHSISKLLAITVIAAPAFAQAPSSVCSQAVHDSLRTYVGRYAPPALDPSGVFTVAVREGELTAAPTFWRPARILTPIGRDTFQLENFRGRQIVFQRDTAGCVSSVAAATMGFPAALHRVPSGDTLPVERLVRGEYREALSGFVTAGADARLLAATAQQMLRVPTLTARTVPFLELASKTFPSNAVLRVALADAQMARGSRAAAGQSYREALALDSANTDARSALERLGLLRPDTTEHPWVVGFSLDSLLRAPAQAEIDTVWARWKRRDLRASGVDTILTRRVNLGSAAATVRIVSHRVHGERHFGAIIIPEGATPGCCPILLSAKGVSPSFSPLRIPEGLDLPSILGADQNRFIYVAPGYRGEVLRIGDDSLRSEGDRADAWDGATDDLLALLDVAIQTTPEADSSRVCVFGRSRGGAVALLAGERDQRIGCVVAWAAPTDWFSLMGGGGWTEAELARDALRHHATPSQLGGQFVDYFLKPAIQGRPGLEDARLHILASSPLFFADHLPWAQVHYGVDDGIVPMANGRRLADRLRDVRRDQGCFQIFFHPDAGHDQDLFVAPRASRQMLLRMRNGALRASCHRP